MIFFIYKKISVKAETLNYAIVRGNYQ